MSQIFLVPGLSQIRPTKQKVKCLSCFEKAKNKLQNYSYSGVVPCERALKIMLASSRSKYREKKVTLEQIFLLFERGKKKIPRNCKQGWQATWENALTGPLLEQRDLGKREISQHKLPKNFRKGKNRESNLLLNISQKSEKLYIKAS